MIFVILGCQNAEVPFMLSFQPVAKIRVFVIMTIISAIIFEFGAYVSESIIALTREEVASCRDAINRVSTIQPVGARNKG